MLNIITMNIVLISLHEFHEYILINIAQLIRLGHTSIFVLTNRRFFDKFSAVKQSITLIAVEDLDETYHFAMRCSLDRGNPVWLNASLRFFYLYSFMKTYDITDVIHIENDVLLYYDCSILQDKLDNHYIYMPFDTYTRNIASIVYVPNHDILKIVLDNYDYTINDMENFSIIMKNTGTIKAFPIFVSNKDTTDMEKIFVTEHYEQFQYIFDAAAIGQYLGGVDPKNKPGDTKGFVNEKCIIKYNAYEFRWKYINAIRKPFLAINNQEIPIFNLHIHCKNLLPFV